MLEELAAKCNVETPTGSPSKHLHRLRIEEANGNAANVPVTYLDEISATLPKQPSLQKSISSLSISSPEFPPNSRTLICIIRHVFSNVDCLSKSFKVAEEECDNGDIFPNGNYAGVQKFGGVDLDATKTAFEIILDLEPRDKVTLALTNAIEIALAKLSAVPRSLTDPDDIAPILILLENPLLSDSVYQESLLKPLCLTIAGLRQKVKSILVGWFSWYAFCCNLCGN
ncbi:hypothetical protein BKA69DRAFT_1057050 [Paraphysoderma sedebokerense]|nr:hypothetical protein BKA69DRAFT_1057050 [Paraphysoderma sedebokerense]